jgi:hypothetical protein
MLKRAEADGFKKLNKNFARTFCPEEADGVKTRAAALPTQWGLYSAFGTLWAAHNALPRLICSHRFAMGRK